MFTTLALTSALIGLLLILFLVYREVKNDIAPMERSTLMLVSVVFLVVAGWHIVAGLGGSGVHH
jgi:hypothetical protein